MAKRNFAIHALGSPTLIMQQYQFDVLVDMVMAAKRNLPPDRPLHLFGAGHPMMFSLAVALGCDIFDSASYALYARNGRYMTPQGTAKLEDLEYFPCNCPSCYKNTPEKARRLLLPEREQFLASHNLHSCFTELQTVKQAILDGRLWELLESRSRNHPALQHAYLRLLHYAKDLETETPIKKRKGQFVATPESLQRPEILRYERRLLEEYRPPAHARTVLLTPESFLKAFRENLPFERLLSTLQRKQGLHICTYNLAFAVIPQELLDVFPLSQTVQALPPTPNVIRNATRRIQNYVDRAGYKYCIIVTDEPWTEKVAKSLQGGLKRQVRTTIVHARSHDAQSLRQISKALSSRIQASEQAKSKRRA
jgi:7-cyano-7-deazaguanine tRNA-ribosyltransferase